MTRKCWWYKGSLSRQKLEGSFLSFLIQKICCSFFHLKNARNGSGGGGGVVSRKQKMVADFCILTQRLGCWIQFHHRLTFFSARIEYLFATQSRASLSIRFYIVHVCKVSQEKYKFILSPWQGKRALKHKCQTCKKIDKHVNLWLSNKKILTTAPLLSIEMLLLRSAQSNFLIHPAHV